MFVCVFDCSDDPGHSVSFGLTCLTNYHHVDIQTSFLNISELFPVSIKKKKRFLFRLESNLVKSR